MAVAQTQYTSWGEAHGVINTVANSVPDNGFASFNEANKAEMIKRKKEDSKVVKARYIHKQSKTERLTKPYCRYAGDPIVTYHFVPDQVYEVPMGLIKEVKEMKAPRRSGLCDDKGNPQANDIAEESVHDFVPLTF